MTEKSKVEKAMEAIAKSREESNRLMGNKPFIRDVPECKTTLYMTKNGSDQRVYNLERVRGYYETHIGCTAYDAAADLDLSYSAIIRSLQKIRSEWRKK